jgi:UDP-N-acetylmuramyl pentapeptide phosphotransferase/UDP-N-acetylglucosamine-1-phosphate transferase
VNLPALLASFTLSAVMSAWFACRRYAPWLDEPGERSLHARPVPRLGGVAIGCGVLLGAYLSWSTWRVLFDPYLIAGAALLWCVALLDDFRSLGQMPRLFCQLLAAVLAVFGANLFLQWEFAAAIWPCLGVLILLWGINLYNFMDGMDGFAGGMALIGFGALGLVGWQQGDMAFAMLCGLLVAACTGFLLLNLPPARLFMGDSGSTLLGYAMVTFSILGWKRSLYPVWMPLILFSPFWLDASITLLKRMLRREKIWQAHRQHYYQRWVLAGFSHRRVVLCEYVLMLICALIALGWHAWGSGRETVIPVAMVIGVYCVLLFVSEKVLVMRKF